jgi:hypothetical protein
LWRAGLLALTLTFLSTVAWGLWSKEAQSSGAVITAGDLELILGPVEWRQTSAGPPAAERQRGDSADSLAAFVAAAGDSLEIRQDILTSLSGDNLHAELSLAWQGAAPDGWSGDFRLLADDGRLIGRADIGQSLAIPAWAVAARADDSPLTAWSVLIELTLEERPLYTADPQAAPPAWDGLVLSLDQVRGQDGAAA